jgi:hypothetical protein
MRRFAAAPQLGGGAWNIAELDQNGMGMPCLFVSATTSGGDSKVAEDCVKLLTLALSLPNGVDDALKLVRAELARVS